MIGFTQSDVKVPWIGFAFASMNIDEFTNGEMGKGAPLFKPRDSTGGITDEIADELAERAEKSQFKKRYFLIHPDWTVKTL